MGRCIDLNADLGEGYGDDAALMDVITSANIACGGHAGDAASMATALALAKAHGVAPGAHPSYPDRANFGRAALDIDPEALRQSLAAQVNALAAGAQQVGSALRHLKPHGALYHAANGDGQLADMLADIARHAGITSLVGPPKGALAAAAQRAGLHFHAEGFADRAYDARGQLVGRALPGAVIADADARTRQAIDLAQHGRIRAITGEAVAMPIQTLCLHGDSPGAAASARAIRAALEAAGITVAAP